MPAPSVPGRLGWGAPDAAVSTSRLPPIDDRPPGLTKRAICNSPTSLGATVPGNCTDTWPVSLIVTPTELAGIVMPGDST